MVPAEDDKVGPSTYITEVNDTSSAPTQDRTGMMSTIVAKLEENVRKIEALYRKLKQKNEGEVIDDFFRSMGFYDQTVSSRRTKKS